jgi:crotonobetainyl-CoA:carnitine CoA-transferase CaiB-like acyl-CoA transferase
MQAPLDGIRVVELASYVAAPAAGALLADLGAEVIKVEIPQGEIYRHAQPRYAGIDSDFTEAPHFQMDNRGKRSLALDLLMPGALDALRRVIGRSDVLLTNMLPHRLEKYGLDSASLRAGEPGLIFASMSGYGPDGPDATTPAFDYTAYWARTGFMDQMREPDTTPAFQRPGIGDHAAALSMVSGILAALRMRDRTGEGQDVAVSLMHIGYYIQGNDVATTLATDQAAPRHDRRAPRNPLWNQYPVQGGRWLFLVMIESDRYWPRLCKAVGRADLEGDPRFDGAIQRFKNSAELVRILEETFAQRTLVDWRPILDEHDLIWAPVNRLDEAIRDPQARSAGVFQTVEHPTAGPFETVAPPLRLSAYAMRGDRPAPALGAEGEQILREAGLSADEVAAILG